MTILSNNKNTIQISLSNQILQDVDDLGNIKSYTVDMPTVVCKNSKDAEYIQSEINKYVHTLGRALLKK